MTCNWGTRRGLVAYCVVDKTVYSAILGDSNVNKVNDFLWLGYVAFDEECTPGTGFVHFFLERFAFLFVPAGKNK